MQTNNKLREALELAKSTFETLIKFQGDEDFVKTWAELGREAMIAALAIPPRNCDLPKVAEDPWRAWLDDESNWEDGNPKLEIHDWLLATATEKEGGNNG